MVGNAIKIVGVASETHWKRFGYVYKKTVLPLCRSENELHYYVRCTVLLL